MTSVSSAISPVPKEEQELLHENKIVLLWSLSVWLVVMNTTMFNVALPTVKAELTLTSVAASWIVSGYSIAFAISALTYSRLSDFLPIRRLLLFGLAMLGLSSIIGLFATQFEWLLVARTLQAVGAGAVPGLGMVLAGRYIPLARRGRAMSMIASAASLGFGLGPVIGGAITQYFGWNFLFVITGFVVFLTPVFFRLLPSEAVFKVNFDFGGAILTAIGVTGLLIFLSTQTMYYLLASMCSFLFLWNRINKISFPFIQPELIRNKQYLKLVFIAFTAFIIHFSSLFLMPIILSTVFGKDPAAIGMMIFPGAILSAVAAQFIGRLIDRFGNAPIMMTGQILLLIATVLFAFFSTVTPYAIMFTYMFMSTGFSALTSSNSNEVTRLLPKQEVGAGMGLVQLSQFIGGAFGVALSGLLLLWRADLSVVTSYRNIFLSFSFLLVLSMALFLLYIKRENHYEK